MNDARRRNSDRYFPKFAFKAKPPALYSPMFRDVIGDDEDMIATAVEKAKQRSLKSSTIPLTGRKN